MIRCISRFLLPALLLLYSCSPSSKKLILGKWKFDHIETKEVSRSSTPPDDMEAMTNSLLSSEYEYMTMQFYSNGECVIYKNMFSNQSRRPYTVTEAGEVLETTDEFGEVDYIQIVRIDEKELAILDGDLTIVLVRE